MFSVRSGVDDKGAAQLVAADEAAHPSADEDSGVGAGAVQLGSVVLVLELWPHECA